MIDAAAVLFIDNGLHKTTIDMVATHAGCPREIVQQLYPSKRSLVEDVIEVLCRSAIVRIQHHRSRDVGHLAAVLTRWTYFAVSRPGFLNLYNEIVAIDRPCVDGAGQHRARLSKALARVLANSAAGDSLRTKAKADFLFTVIIGIATQHIYGNPMNAHEIRRHIELVLCEVVPE
ncbi:TetR/AcrR family transcriptional regulator [Nocardia sp. NPDC004573]